MKILIALGFLVGIIFLYILAITLLPGFQVPRQKLTALHKRPTDDTGDHSLPRKDVSFKVQGIRVNAWLYLPVTADGPYACLVMAHGLGGTRDMLEHYARRFQAAGLAVLNFDYRHFGDSEGEPRQLIWIPYQLADWAAAINYAASINEIDPKRIGLWGTSMSGGHVITTAARNKNISCAVAQCPGVDGMASGKLAFETFGLKYILRMVMNGQRDYFRSFVGLSAHKIPVVGQPGSIALMTTPRAWDFFQENVLETYVNEACARIVLRGDKYRPIKYAGEVRCPVLIQGCEKDKLIPVEAVRATAEKMGSYAQAVYYPIGHFDIYSGKHYEKAIGDQLTFLLKHLRNDLKA